MNWLLLRGLGREKMHWEYLAPILKKKMPGSEFHFLDLPGAGEFHQDTPPITPFEFIKTLKTSFSQHHLYSKDLSIVGLSLGSMCALNWAKQYPDDFKKIVLINPSLKKINFIFDRLTLYGIKKLLQIFLIDNPVDRELQILELTSEKHAGDPQLAIQFANIANLHPMTRLHVLRQLWVASQMAPPEKQDITAPITVMVSGNDKMVSPECGKKIAKHFNAQLFIHPSAGHDLPLDDPDWFATKLAQI